MGGKQSISQPSADAQNDENALTQIATQQASNSNQLFNASFPGMVQSEQQAQTLASGDPYAIARAISPVAQQTSIATSAAKQNILNSGPAGGEKNLALEQADVNQGAKVGDAATQGYLNSFNALASMGATGTGLGISSAGAATSGFNSAGSLSVQQEQLGIQQKGNTLGAFSSLGSDAATIGAAALL